MFFIVILTLYSYLLIKSFLYLFYKKFYLLEVKILILEIPAFIITSTFFYNYFLIGNEATENYLVSKKLIILCLIAGIVIYSVGAGIKLALYLINDKEHDIDIKLKVISSIYINIWVNTSLKFIYLILCLVEISTPGKYKLEIQNNLIIFLICILYGSLNGYIFIKRSHVIRNINFIINLILCITLILLTLESSTTSTITLSFLFITSSFTISSLFVLLYSKYVYKIDLVKVDQPIQVMKDEELELFPIEQKKNKSPFNKKKLYDDLILTNNSNSISLNSLKNKD